MSEDGRNNRDSLGHILPKGKTADEDRIHKMDTVAESLLALIASEKTTDTQKGRFFAQVMSWYKIRPTLIPSGEGGKLEEMSHGIKSASGKRSGSAGSAGRRARQSRAIKDIIASLPKSGAGAAASSFGQRSANGGDAEGDQSSVERSGGSADSDGVRLRVNGDGDDSGDGDGARDLH